MYLCAHIKGVKLIEKVGGQVLNIIYPVKKAYSLINVSVCVNQLFRLLYPKSISALLAALAIGITTLCTTLLTIYC